MASDKIVDWEVGSLDSSGNLAIDGTLTGDVTGDLTGTWIAGTTNFYIADGAISVDDDIAVLDSTNATTAMQLSSTANGRRMTIVVKAYTEVADVDFNLVGAGASTATFSEAGESITLIYVASALGWVIIGNNGAVIS